MSRWDLRDHWDYEWEGGWHSDPTIKVNLFLSFSLSSLSLFLSLSLSLSGDPADEVGEQHPGKQFRYFTFTNSIHLLVYQQIKKKKTSTCSFQDL